MGFSLLVGGGGQALSLLDWDLAVRLGLQENDRHSSDVIQRLLAEVEWGVCVADVFLVLPLLMIGLAGVLCRRHWGMIAAMMAALCWVDMFLVYTAQRYALVFRGGMGQWSDYAGLAGTFAVLGPVPSLLTIWGLAANADRFATSRPHSHMLHRKQDGLEPFFLENPLLCTGQVLRTVPQVWIGKRLTWNTRPGELTRPLTGDAFVAGGTTVHRAITIARPPERVWPWVAQFGRGAAYYSWDFLDNRGHRHADYLLDVCEPQVGDWNEDLGKVRHVETGTELVWYDEPVFFGLRAPLAITFRLDPEPSEATRLHFRMSVGLPRAGLRARIALRVGLLMDQVMSTEMLRRLKFLIETYEERVNNGELNQSLAPHQRSRWRGVSQAQAANEREGDCAR
jgi:hypothetical protein